MWKEGWSEKVGKEVGHAYRTCAGADRLSGCLWLFLEEFGTCVVGGNGT